MKCSSSSAVFPAETIVYFHDIDKQIRTVLLKMLGKKGEKIDMENNILHELGSNKCFHQRGGSTGYVKHGNKVEEVDFATWK